MFKKKKKKKNLHAIVKLVTSSSDPASCVDHLETETAQAEPLNHQSQQHTLIQDQSDSEGNEMFYLTTHSTHFIYGYMVSDIWLRTILIVGKETRCRHIGYSFRFQDFLCHEILNVYYDTDSCRHATITI